MSALQSKLYTLYKNPGYGLRFFIDGIKTLFGHGCDFGTAPKFALVASGTFFGVYRDNLQCFLLIEL
jgi:hypothetical protein